MQPKQVHDFLFELYRYANYLADCIQPGNRDNNTYWTSLIYIEDMMDVYGRGLISQTARAVMLDDRASLQEAHRQIDLLRTRMTALKAEYQFDDALNQTVRRMQRNWGS